MKTISSYLSGDHDRCDDLFAQAERSIDAQDWPAAERDFGTFRTALDQHLAFEESVLFPAFESATGSSAGPTAVMRMEHEQMREIARQMAEALIARDATDFLGCSETLNTMMQQHNMKEEGILYPMCDRALGERRDAVMDALETQFAAD